MQFRCPDFKQGTKYWYERKITITVSSYVSIIAISLATIVYLLSGYNKENLKILNSKLRPDMQYSKPQFCSIPTLQNLDQFFQYIDGKAYPCKNLLTVGGHPVLNYEHIIDGDKKVCMDPELDFKRGNCTVLSFGISTDWTFDDEMDKIYKCKVFSFDPSNGLPDHARSSRLKFYQLGLGSYEGVKKFQVFYSKIDRYDGIIYRLGLQNTLIDYLKMDVEGSETDFLEEIFDTSFHLLNNIKQIAIEIHPAAPKTLNNYVKLLWESFHKFECHGFRMTMVSLNMVPTNLYKDTNGILRSRCYEIVWAKL